MNRKELRYLIEGMSAEIIDEILLAVIRRKRELYPDWEIIYYAKRKGETDDPEELRWLLQNGGLGD